MVIYSGISVAYLIFRNLGYAQLLVYQQTKLIADQRSSNFLNNSTAFFTSGFSNIFAFNVLTVLGFNPKMNEIPLVHFPCINNSEISVSRGASLDMLVKAILCS